MRIVALLPLYPPRSLVGAWITTHEYLAHMVTRGHQATVVQTISAEPAYTIDGVEVVGRKVMPHLHQYLSVADVVITHLGGAAGIDREVARYDVPTVRLAHGADIDLERLQGAALIVWNSESLRDQVGWDGPQIVVHPPIHADRYVTTPGDRVTLVNLNEAKGGALFWRLARCAPHVEFLGVLGGYGSQLREIAPNVDVVGATADMREIYGRTRILLMPSERETYGRVGVEAMCSGIPVIAHPTPGLAEALGDAALFVDRADGQGWLDAIDQLGDPAEWRRWSARSSARVAGLQPVEDMNRFAAAVEAVARQGVPA